MNPNGSRVQSGQIVQQLQKTPESNRQAVLMEYLTVLIQDLLALDPTERFGPKQRLFELGFASRNVIELKDRLELAFNTLLPVTLFFQYATLELLTTHLLTEVLEFTAAPQPHLHTQPETLKKPTAAETAALETLSDAEVEARILEKIAAVEKRLEP